MSFVQDLRQTPRLGLLVGGAAATIGVIYGYDLSNIAGALLFITEHFDLTTRQQELVTTAVVVGEVLGAVIGGWLANLLGRKVCMVGVAASYAAFAVLSAMAVSVPMLMELADDTNKSPPRDPAVAEVEVFIKLMLDAENAPRVAMPTEPPISAPPVALALMLPTETAD